MRPTSSVGRSRWSKAVQLGAAADGVPLASYRPRGSTEAVANIESALKPGAPAVLLANHSVLVFHRTPELAILVGGVVEEAAQAAINSAGIGGAVALKA